MTRYLTAKVKLGTALCEVEEYQLNSECIGQFYIDHCKVELARHGELGNESEHLR